jgi:hypothetical protein
MSYKQAETILSRTKITETTFCLIKVSVLQELCMAHSITVKHTGARKQAI